MKGLDVNAKKQYETPTMELLVITGREIMDSTDHDNGYIDSDDFFGSVFRWVGYYDV